MLLTSLIILPTISDRRGLRSRRGGGWHGGEGVREMVILVKRVGKSELADKSILMAFVV